MWCVESIDFHIGYYYINCNKINGIGFIENRELLIYVKDHIGVL